GGLRDPRGRRTSRPRDLPDGHDRAVGPAVRPLRGAGRRADPADRGGPGRAGPLRARPPRADGTDAGFLTAAATLRRWRDRGGTQAGCSPTGGPSTTGTAATPTAAPSSTTPALRARG